MKKNNSNNNVIRFPGLIGSRFRVSTSKTSNNKIDDIDNYVFYGNKLVLKFRGPTLNSYDMWLYFQLIESFQKKTSSSEKKDEFVFDEEISIDTKKILFDEYKEKYRPQLNYLELNEKKDFIKNKIDEEISKRIEKIEKELYLNSSESIVTNIDLGDILKDRGLINNVRNRESISYSLERLQSIGLTWYVLSDELSSEFKQIKAKYNNNSSLYKDELKKHFESNKRKTTLYMRSLLEGVTVSLDFKKSVVKLDKKFYELTLNSELFDFSLLRDIKGNLAKTLYVNLNFAYKPKMTKEYLYEIFCLSEENREDNKLSQSKKAIEELIKVGVLEKVSGYDKETKTFNFYITEEYKKIMGLKNQIEYSKNKPLAKKAGNKK